MTQKNFALIGAAGYFELAHARVRWFLSVNAGYLPHEASARNMRTYRSILVAGEKIDFSGGFTDLHTVSYQEVLAGQGFPLEEARPSLETVYTIRNADPEGLTGDYHPFLK